MAKIPSPIPGYYPNKTFQLGIEPFECLREGFVSCFDFGTNTEGCYEQSDSAVIQNTGNLCTDVING